MRKADLARLLDVSPSQAANYIDGSSHPKIDGLIQLAQYFNVSLDDLVLVDLEKEEGRTYGGGEVESSATPDQQSEQLIKLLSLRLMQLEEEFKNVDPERAKKLGIE